jgi:hypothetical protein
MQKSLNTALKADRLLSFFGIQILSALSGIERNSSQQLAFYKVFFGLRPFSGKR